MSKFDRNRIKDGWEKLCTNKQTNRQTDRQTNRHYENNGHLAVNQQQYLLHKSSEYDERWLRSVRELEAPSKFQRVSRTAPKSCNRSQPNFARCLTVSWASTLYIHFWGLLPLTEFCQVRQSVVLSYTGSVTARHSSSGRQPNFATWYLHTRGRPSHSTSHLWFLPYSCMRNCILKGSQYMKWPWKVTQGHRTCSYSISHISLPISCP